MNDQLASPSEVLAKMLPCEFEANTGAAIDAVVSLLVENEKLWLCFRELLDATHNGELQPIEQVTH